VSSFAYRNSGRSSGARILAAAATLAVAAAPGFGSPPSVNHHPLRLIFLQAFGSALETKKTENEGKNLEKH
jgi:hypothetical protein